MKWKLKTLFQYPTDLKLNSSKSRNQSRKFKLKINKKLMISPIRNPLKKVSS